MGEENENRRFLFFAEGPDGQPKRIGPLGTVVIKHAPDLRAREIPQYIDLADRGGIALSGSVEITPKGMYALLGPPPALRGRKGEWEAFKREMWPLLSDERLSRKRFKKLLMSHGVSRNVAEIAILTYNKCKVPYIAAYKEIVTLALLEAFVPTEPQKKD